MAFDFEKEKKQIIDSLIERGYNEKIITYSEFLQLYEKYKNTMSEKEFAQILGLSSRGSFQLMKSHGVMSKILTKPEISIEKAEELREGLLKRGLANKKINYSDFLKLYKPYMSEINEVTFAKILGINYAALRNLKNKNTETVILQMPQTQPTKERREEIRAMLMEEKSHNSSITYSEFMGLYEQYKEEMTEIQFAAILDISSNNLSQIKSVPDKKCIILKRPKLTERRKQEIKKVLIDDEQNEKEIDYQTFLSLFKPYMEEMTEREFAHDILGIEYRTFSRIKSENKKAKIAIKNDGNLTDEKIDEIYGFVKEKGYAGKRITYNEFLQLYGKYRSELTEIEFANAMGISNDSFEKLKSQIQRATVIKQEEEETTSVSIDASRKREILEEVKSKTSAKYIKYDEFLTLYEPYKNEISDVDFAYLLGISEQSFDNFKRYNKNATKILSRKYAEDEIKVDGIEDGIYLDYAEFLQLYQKYKNVMSEKDFSEKLGIEYVNYWRMKKRRI